MNKAEFKAISIIADKLSWQNKPVMEVCETIKQMVRNQQSLELDTVGECDDFEETLLSIALWDADKIRSTMFVTDYCSLQEWSWNIFCEDMGITNEDMVAMMHWYNVRGELLAAEYETEDIAYEEYLNEYYSDFDAEMLRETMWITKHC